MPKLSPELLSVLRCPVTGSLLEQDGDELVSTAPGESGQKLRYPIADGIPLLLPPELRPAGPTADAARQDPARHSAARHAAAPLPASE